MMKIDHVTLAGSSLAELEKAFKLLGLSTDYGGAHSNDITHMSLLGFSDGSYIELISNIESPTKDHTFWGQHIAHNGGPCAWAIHANDVSAEASRIKQLSIPVDGPHYYQRQRPDGQLVEWKLAFLDDKGAGATLPFIIKDITPRQLRVTPSASISDLPLTGINKVILGTQNLNTAIEQFQHVYGWSAPEYLTDETFGAKLAHFSNTPVILAAPTTSNSRLAKRLKKFGNSPCAFLIGTTDFATNHSQFLTTPAINWFGQQIAWFQVDGISPFELGIIQ